VYEAAHAAQHSVVVCSCGIDGNSIKAQEVMRANDVYDDQQGYAHFPALYIQQQLGDNTGAVQGNDSGSPVIRSCSANPNTVQLR
jgi:hypothetical protein